MIASLRGIIIFKSTHYIIVEVQGVGYGVYVSLSTFYKLPEIGDTVFLNIHTYVKEDLIHLFGFFSPEEKQIFQNIISVSGIGPRLAVNILSGISPEDLTDAIASKNTTILTAIPGVGPKMADRLIFMLKDKLSLTARKETAVCRRSTDNEVFADDALSALINLGYKPAVAKKAVDRACKECKDRSTLKAILTESLKYLSQ